MREGILRTCTESARETASALANISALISASNISESKDPYEESGSAGTSTRLVAGRLQNLLLLCQIAVDKRDRHATKKKQYFVTIVYVLGAVLKRPAIERETIICQKVRQDA